MIESKWLDYSCLQICNVDAQLIDWIVDLSIESNEHRNKIRNNTSPHPDDEITGKKISKSIQKSLI